MSTMASTPSPPSSILSRTAKVFRVSLDLASAYLHAGQEVAAERLLCLVEFELPYWSRDSVLGHGIADAELHVLRGEKEKALAALQKAQLEIPIRFSGCRAEECRSGVSCRWPASTRSLGEVRLQLFTDGPLPMLRPDAEDLPLEEPLAHFAEHGYARLGPVLDGEGAARLVARADDLMMSDAPHPGMFYQHDSDSGCYADLQFNVGWVGPSPRYRKLERLELEPLFMNWVGNALFKRIARVLLDEPVRLYRAVLWNKAPGGSMAVPWHQDDGKFWGLNRAPFLQIWTALDDAPVESGCLEVLPGSHAGGLASPEGGTVSEACLARADAERQALPLPVLRGESIMVHNHTWHRTRQNRTPIPRRAISVSFLGADTHCIRRRREPREFKRLFADE